MSQRKRPHLEVGSIGGSAESGGNMDSNSSADVAETANETGFDLLPDEMLVEVFSYFGHKDKLGSRLVSKRWCKVMTSWTGFQNSVQYRVKKKEALAMLRKSDSFCSTVSFDLNNLLWFWIQDFCAWNGVVNNVTSLELNSVHRSSCTLKLLKLLITKFNNLRALDLCVVISGADEFSQEMAMTRDEELVEEKLTAAVKNLRRLSLDFGPHPDKLAKALLLLKGLKNLFELEVSYYDYSDRLDQLAHKASVESLCDIISTSRKTLKTLKLKRDHFEPELLDRIQELSNLVELNLEGRCDLQLQQRCLGSLNKLENVVLYTSDIAGDCLEIHDTRDLLAVLPRTVRLLELGGTQGSFFIDEKFINMFPHLTNLKAENHVETMLETDLKFEQLLNLNCRAISVRDWANACPNLTELEIYQWGTEDEMNAFCDDDMQAIIKNLKGLKCLRLNAHHSYITDYGVTGIRKEYCKFLLETRSFDRTPHVYPEFEKGLPLCALAELKTLHLGVNLDISDVGIRFGFCFKELNSLKMGINDEFYPPAKSPVVVTDTGFACLGEMNPNLEYLEIELGCNRTISPIGVSNLLSHLRRIKHHNLDSQFSNLTKGTANMTNTQRVFTNYASARANLSVTRV